MDQFAEVLFSMNKHCFSLLTVWLKEALQSPGFPSTRVSDEQKDTFSQQVLRYCSLSNLETITKLFYFVFCFTALHHVIPA